MFSFNQLKKNLKKDTQSLKEIKISILAESSVQLLVQGIKGYGIELGYNFNIQICGYNQIDLQIFEPKSDLNTFSSNFIIILPSTHKILKEFYATASAEKTSFADNYILQIINQIDSLTSKSNAKILYSNFIEINDSVFGNYSSKVESSFIFQLRKINFELMKLSQKYSNLFINDIASLQNQFGNSFTIDNKFYINSDMTLSIDFIPYVSKNIIDIIKSIDGKINKCLIIDLDNTLWGGIIGDDGIENIELGDYGIGKAYTELQLWIKQLKERGILLAICSKNTESIAQEPFLKHPDMVLKLDDFAVFVANWESKVDNIRYIQSILNIGFDSMVFIDDNPFERNMVLENIEGITVPDLPEDPSNYLSLLRSLNLFETATYTEEDSERTHKYQEETKRIVYQKSFSNEGEYLKGLNMIAKVEEFNNFNIPRVAQLTQRSNQFNLRTVRYTEHELEQIVNSSKYITFCFTLSDKFGNHGLISIIILKIIEPSVFFIDTWLMSCRVLKRGMENFVLNTITKKVKSKGGVKLTGEYLPTQKNDIVAEHFQNLGFKKVGQNWELDIEEYEPKYTAIFAD